MLITSNTQSEGIRRTAFHLDFMNFWSRCDSNAGFDHMGGRYYFVALAQILQRDIVPGESQYDLWSSVSKRSNRRSVDDELNGASFLDCEFLWKFRIKKRKRTRRKICFPYQALWIYLGYFVCARHVYSMDFYIFKFPKWRTDPRSDPFESAQRANNVDENEYSDGIFVKGTEMIQVKKPSTKFYASSYTSISYSAEPTFSISLV